MDANIATVFVAAIAAVTSSVVAPIITYWLKYRQDKNIAEGLNLKADIADEKLDGIHAIVNSQHDEMVRLLKVKMDLLLQLAPDDPRVRELLLNLHKDFKW